MPRKTSKHHTPVDRRAGTSPDGRLIHRGLAMIEILDRQPPTMPTAALRALVSRHFPA